MKRKKWFIWGGLGLFVIVAILLIWVWQGSPLFKGDVALQVSKEPLILNGVNSAYQVKVTVDPKEKKVESLLRAKVKNDTGKDLDQIFFHIYPNQFRKENPLMGEVWKNVLGNKAQPGWMKVEDVQVGGQKVKYEVKDTVLSVPAAWKKNSEAEVVIRYSFGLPQNNGRLSYDEHAIWMGNWLPIKAVYDEEGWNLDPYYPIGDPFYSDVADYEVEVLLPKGYQAATTGVEVAGENGVEGNLEIHRFKADKVRDFAMVVMDGEYAFKEGKAGNVRVLTWYRKKDLPEVVNKLHNVAIQSINTYGKTYGEYPYPEYDVVATGGFFGGMEYPGLIFAQGSYFERKDPYGIIVVAHETAHQWWYGLVGNDEVEHPWMDESLTEYTTLQYLLEYEKGLAQVYQRMKESALERAGNLEKAGEKISSAVNQFRNWDSYGSMIYEVGPMMFVEWEKKVGKGKMEAFLRDYFTRYRYKNATPLDFLGVMKEHFGDEGVRFMESWLEGKEAVS